MSSRIQTAWREGKITIVWIIVTIVYLVLKILHIEASEFTNAFVAVTGVFIGDLGIKQTRRKAEETAKIEKKADHAVIVAEKAVEVSTGGIPPIIQDKDTGELRAQRPPRIAREGDKNA